MPSVTKKSFDAADEVRKPAKAEVDVVDLGSAHVARMTLQPGWTWSESVKPIVQTESCQVRHLGAAISGHLHVRHDDGSEIDIGPGDVYTIEPGHDAWVTGDEAFVGHEFEDKTASSFASPG